MKRGVYNIHSPVEVKKNKRLRICLGRMGSDEMCLKEFMSQGNGNRMCCDCNEYINKRRRGTRFEEVYC